MGYSLAQLKQFLLSAGASQSEADLLGAIGTYEQPQSDPNFVRVCPGNPYCLPGQGAESSVGPWQINTLVHRQWSLSWLRDPVNNAKAALQILRSPEGIGAWKLSYQKYLKNGGAAVTSGGSGGSGYSVQPASLWSIISGSVPSGQDKYNAVVVAHPRMISGRQRYVVAVVIAIVVISFAWNKF